MRNTRTAVLATLALGGICTTFSPAGVPICGTVTSLVCPGCTPGQPSDSSCFCGPVSQACECRKTTGGRQTGFITTCFTNTFDFVEPGPKLIVMAKADALCKRVKKCVRPNASQVNCGILSQPICESPPNEGCSWLVWQETKATPWEERDNCGGT